MVKGKVVAANLGLPANRAPAARLETYLPYLTSTQLS